MAGANQLERGDRPRQAHRIDPDAGYRERHEFWDVNGAAVFVCDTAPIAPARGTVLVCSSILNDLTINGRREVLAARAMAARGLRVLRFHYRGTGHSGGDETDVSFTTMVDDAGGVLAQAGGRDPVGLLGTRMGAIIAAAVARDLDAAPVALWEPTLAARSFFREAIRAAMTRRVKGGPGGVTQADFAAAFSAGGVVDLLGHQIHSQLHNSLEGLALAECLGTRRRPLLLVQLASGGGLRREYSDAADAWRAADLEVQTMHEAVQQMWWFEEFGRPAERLIDATAAWMERALQSGGAG